MNTLVSTNPAAGYEVVGEVTISTAEEITVKVAAAKRAERGWKELGVAARIEKLRPIQAELSRRGEEIAQMITREVGKPLAQSRREAAGYGEEFTWFLDNAARALAAESTHEDQESVHRIVYEPLGTAAVITPWNFPFGMAVWGIVPNLLAGNPVVFKISEECPLVGRIVEDAFAVLPDGVFAEVYGSRDVGEKLAGSGVNLIWFTGSTRTGQFLYRLAGEKFIKAVLEMGGSNPCVVFDDAAIPEAARIIYSARFGNCGQVCSAVKRLIVHDSVKDALVDELASLLHAKRLGDPTDDATEIGSLAAERQLTLLSGQVGDALDKGARVAANLAIPPGLRGAYATPMILDNVTRDMRVWSEEVFGPVLPLVTFTTEDEAVELANDTIYGLGGRVISADRARAGRVASRIDAGTVEINAGNRWLPCNPFGGYKLSGMGREHGALGLRELSQVKVISASR